MQIMRHYPRSLTPVRKCVPVGVPVRELVYLCSYRQTNDRTGSSHTGNQLSYRGRVFGYCQIIWVCYSPFSSDMFNPSQLERLHIFIYVVWIKFIQFRNTVQYYHLYDKPKMSVRPFVWEVDRLIFIYEKTSSHDFCTRM